MRIKLTRRSWPWLAALGCSLALAACTRDAPSPTLPTPTPAISAARAVVLASTSVKELACYEIFEPPVLDGELGDWSTSGKEYLDFGNASYTSGSVDDEADLSAEFRSRFDSEYVYFGVRVWDNRIIADSATQIWHDDGIELALDGAGDGSAYGPDDHQYTIRTDGYLTDRGMTHPSAIGDVDVRVLVRNDGYIVEARIPLSRLGSAPASYGRVIGFTLGLHDDDNGGRFDAYAIWEGNNTYNGAARFGKLVFVASGPTPTPSITGSPTRTSEIAPTSTRTPTPTSTTEFASPTSTPTAVGASSTATSTSAAPATPTRTPTITNTPAPASGIVYPVADTFVSAWDPFGSFGNSFTARIRPGEMSALLRFDLSQVPTSATLLQATLRVYTIQKGAHPLPVNIYRLIRYWAPSQANWFRARNEVTWTGAGATGAGSDYHPSGASELTFVDQNVFVEADVRAIAQEWVNHPDRNYGLVLHGGGGVAVEYSIITADNPVVELRPRLELRWAMLGATATPTAKASATPTGTRPNTPTPTNTPLATLSPTPTPQAGDRIVLLRAEIEALEAEADRMLTILQQASGAAPPKPPTPTPLPKLSPEEEAIALERRVRELEDLIGQMEDILRKFGDLP
jgi:hypothetical protein